MGILNVYSIESGDTDGNLLIFQSRQIVILKLTFLKSLPMPQLRYITPSGITVTRTSSKVPFARGLAHILQQLDTKRGVYLSSGYEYPGRYSRWDVASVAPVIEIVGRERKVDFTALNQRGQVLLTMLDALFTGHPHVDSRFRSPYSLTVQLRPLPDRFPEEERS